MNSGATLETPEWDEDHKFNGKYAERALLLRGARIKLLPGNGKTQDSGGFRRQQRLSGKCPDAFRGSFPSGSYGSEPWTLRSCGRDPGLCGDQP